MKRMITKQTTIKPTGSGVANMGKPIGKFERTSTVVKTSPLAKLAPGMPSFAMEVTKSSGNKKTATGAGMPRLAMKRTAVTLGSGPTKAKMLPEVTVKSTKIKSAKPSKMAKAIKAKAMSLNYKNK